MTNSYRLLLPAELNFLAPSIVDDLRRIGGPNDGGYVVPQSAVENTECVLAFGVARDWTFEEQFLQLNPTVTVHAYDHSISARKLGRNILWPLREFWSAKSTLWPMVERARLWLAYRRFFRGRAVHFTQRIVADVRESYDADLSVVFGRTPARRIFVKCDIEGSEYEIIDDLLSHADRIVGMVVEFHSTASRRLDFLTAVQRLLGRFTLVHVHANNYGELGEDGLPDVLELTFMNGTGAAHGPRRTEFPLPGLDRPCNPEAHDYRFSFQL